MKTIQQMTVGKQYQCTRQVGAGKDIYFRKGGIYTCTDISPYINTLTNEQGQTHTWASEKGREQFGQINDGWNDDWADYFTEL